MKSIYYCISGPPSAGGQHVNVEHVAALRALGLRAYLLYIPKGSEVERFECPAPIVLSGAHLQTQDDDIIVVPEAWPKVLRHFAGRPGRKLIHCQNPYYVFHSFESISAVETTGYREMLSCSGYTTGMLRRFGYRNPIHTVRPGVPAVFQPATEPQALQIAYMPRKRENETLFVKGLFQSLYPQYREVPWVPICNMSRDECARVMQKSAVFAAFGFTEGLGLPPLEAMACGCLVAGFDGLGGADYTHPGNGFWVAEGDYFAFAHQLAQAIAASRDALWRREIQENCTRTLQNYSPTSFQSALAEAWRLILGARYDGYLLDAG